MQQVAPRRRLAKARRIGDFTAMALFSRNKDASPDQTALARVGETVRARLDANPNVHKVPVKSAEIYAMGGFLTIGECFHMRALIDMTATPSTLFEGSHVAGYRTSYSGNLDRDDTYVRMIERRIDDLLGMEPEWGETVQGQRYQPGQEYKAHHDWFAYHASHWKQESKLGGQRSWTAMAYLNDVEEGGETNFINAGVSIKPQEGSLVIWNNATPEGVPNDMTLHAGTPPVKGTKYVLTKWYRTRRWGTR